MPHKSKRIDLDQEMRPLCVEKFDQVARGCDVQERAWRELCVALYRVGKPSSRRQAGKSGSGRCRWPSLPRLPLLSGRRSLGSRGNQSQNCGKPNTLARMA